MIVNEPTQLFLPADADMVAAAMQDGEDEGWTYKAVHDPNGTGYSFIEIRDEAGILVGKV
jgi:hypothetical protein